AAGADHDDAVAVGPQREGLLAGARELLEHLGDGIAGHRALLWRGRGVPQVQGPVGAVREGAQPGDLRLDRLREGPARAQMHRAGEAGGGMRAEPGEVAGGGAGGAVRAHSRSRSHSSWRRCWAGPPPSWLLYGWTTISRC